MRTRCVLSIWLISTIFMPCVNNRDVIGKRKVPCVKRLTTDLAKQLGAGFNSRYMSTDKPFVPVPKPKRHGVMDKAQLRDVGMQNDFAEEPWFESGTGPEREHELSFKVSDKYVRILGDTIPITSNLNYTFTRSKREAEVIFKSFVPAGGFQKKVTNNDAPTEFGPWSCTYKYKWMDLGNDHFPRYLRHVECDKKVCWFGFYECTPRAFTVTVLRRVSDSCFVDDSEPDGGTEDHSAFEDWVFEERAVAFCCECTKTWNSDL